MGTILGNNTRAYKDIAPFRLTIGIVSFDLFHDTNGFRGLGPTEAAGVG